MSLRERVHLVAAGNQGLAHSAELARAGIPTSTVSRAVARGELVRVAPAVYAAGPLPPWPPHLVTEHGPSPDHVLRVRAALLSRGPAAAAVARTAACLHGWSLLHEPVGVVEIAVPHGCRGARRHRRLPTSLVRPVPGAPLHVTTALATALDLAAGLPPREAVVAVDSALRSGSVSLEELTAVVRRGVPGQAGVAAVLARCDPMAGSVLESVARFDLVEAGLGGFVTQHEVRDRTGVMRCDFCWPGARLVLEVDGARWHPDPRRDQARDNRLAALGYRVVRLTWAQVVHDPGWWEVVARALAEPHRS